MSCYLSADHLLVQEENHIFVKDMISHIIRSKAYIILLVMLGQSMQGFGQTNEGTDFWMAFMQHRNVGNNNMVVMITSKTSTTGTVSIPLRGFNRSFTVEANNVTLIDMPAFAETIGSERIDNNAIHVTSNNLVSVYIHQYQSFRAEASIVLPTNSISNDYYVMTYEGFASEVDGASEFVVVGVEDETEISIDLSDMTKQGKVSGDNITITLNQGETYQVRGLQTIHDFTGTRVTGDKKFSIFAGASYARVPTSCGNRDNLMEQMYPLNTFGSTYVTAPTRQGDFNIFRILAIDDNAEISIIDVNGSQELVELNQGEFYEYRRTVPTVVTNTDPNDTRGFMLGQYLVGSECTGQAFGGPAMVLLSSIEQIRDTVTVYNSNFQNIFENYISIICKTDDIDGIMRNGNEIRSDWTQIGLNGELSFTIEQVQQGRHTLTSSGCGVIAMAYGLGEAEGYAYFGGASFNEINGNPLPDGECVGNPVSFSSGLPSRRYDVEWTSELGDTIYQHEFELDFPDDDEGEYLVKLKTFDNCFLVSDSLEKTIKMTYQTESVIDNERIEICENQLLSLEVMSIENASYEWQGPNDFSSENQNPTLDVDSSDSGEFEVKATIFGCVAKPDFITVLVNPLPTPNLGEDTIFCDRFGIPLSVSPGTYNSYDWADGSSQSSLEVTQEGLYTVTVTDANTCIASDSIFITSQCPSSVYIPTAFSPNDDNINDSFVVNSFDITNLELLIYDRWGMLVFKSQDPDMHWDGKINGQYASPGVYVWMLNYDGFDNDGNPITENQKGHLQLLR